MGHPGSMTSLQAPRWRLVGRPLATLEVLVQELADARKAELVARQAVQLARERQADAVLKLKAGGLDSRTMAHRLLRAEGHLTGFQECARLARALKKLVERETARRGFPAEPGSEIRIGRGQIDP